MACSNHYTYPSFKEKWQTMRDSMDGERAMKDRTLSDKKYIPMTQGQIKDTSGGLKRYNRQVNLAIYYDFVRQIITDSLGLMYNNAPIIKLPKSISEMETSATVNNESLEQLMLNTNKEQMLMGRRGLALDVVDDKSSYPVISEYNAEHILNWNDLIQDGFVNYDFVLLDETSKVMNAAMEWVDSKKFRVLTIVDGFYTTYVVDEKEKAIKGGIPSGIEAVQPSIHGKRYNRVPFVIANVSNTNSAIQNPATLSIADLSIALFRGEADYRTYLHMSGQDTLIFTGVKEQESKNIRLGAGAHCSFSTDAKVFFAGVSGSSLTEMKASNDSIAERIASQGVSFVESGKAESGEALSIRSTTKTASLTVIAKVGARAIETILNMALEWMGSAEVATISPNLEFTETKLTPKDLLDLVSYKIAGGPITDGELRELQESNGYSDGDLKVYMDKEEEESSA